MVLIEGIGDEVIVTLGLGLAFLAVILAWWSTHVPDVRWPRVIQWQVVVARELGAQGTSVEQYTVTSRDDETSALNASAAVIHDAVSSTQQAPFSSPAAAVETIDVSQVASEEQAAASEEQATASEEQAVASEEQATASEVDEASVANANSHVQLEPSNDTSTSSIQVVTSEVHNLDEGADSRCNQEQNELRRRRCNFYNGQTAVDGIAASGTPVAEPNAESMHSAKQPSPSVSCTSQRPVTTAMDGSGTLRKDGNQIRIRLRYMTEDERLVVAHPSTTVISFKRQNFADDLAANKLVRFIFNGQVLQDDRTLESYNIIDNTVVHTLITLAGEGAQQSFRGGGSRQSAAAGGGAAAAAAGSESHDMFDAGSLMVPLFALILAVIWYLRFAYRQFFNVTSTLSLGGITILFGICLYANHRHQRQQPAAAAAAAAATAS